MSLKREQKEALVEELTSLLSAVHEEFVARQLKDYVGHEEANDVMGSLNSVGPNIHEIIGRASKKIVRWYAWILGPDDAPPPA